jgi:MFS family permease
LLVAQFLAAFNDQAIHASAMFFAINTRTLNEGVAITLMPILFYAPWAVFATLAGYFADRFSKRHSLVVWKFVEVLITLTALAGFWLGRHGNAIGPWVVLSTVFLMGMHSAFFVPAKYGAMPEVLQSQLLSRGNGLLESLSFLAIILGTVVGGVLSEVFRGQEYWIGVVLVGLAVLGAIASLFIERMPAANSQRRFPAYLYKPLWDNIRTLFGSRPLAFAVVGIAFFTFLVAYMRGTVYMHGESQSPSWGESHTSIIVGMVALGIGIGSPLAGYLSGRKVEVGLVPIGAVGMVFATLIVAVYLQVTTTMIGCIIAMGFCTGFYLVPLYTLFQERAPKTSVGDLLATSNAFNVTGAIAASVLLMVIITGAHALGLAPRLEQTDVVTGTLGKVHYKQGRLDRVPIGDTTLVPGGHQEVEIDALGYGLQQGEEVIASKYQLGSVLHYRLRLAGTLQVAAYDNSGLPRLLFAGAGVMTLLTLVLLWRFLPDLFLRTLLWAHSCGRYSLEVIGVERVPTTGPLLLVTNASSPEECLHVLAATDRRTRFLVPLPEDEKHPSLLLRWTAMKGLGWLKGPATKQDWEAITARAQAALRQGDAVAVPATEGLEGLLEGLRKSATVSILPVWHKRLQTGTRTDNRIHIVIGDVLSPNASADAVRDALQRAASRND